MSVQAMAWAFQTSIKPAAAKLLLVAIANYANEHGVAWPSKAKLARDCGIDKSGICRHMQTLVDAGLLSIKERRSGQVNLPSILTLSMEMNGTPPSDDDFGDEYEDDEETEGGGAPAHGVVAPMRQGGGGTGARGSRTSATGGGGTSATRGGGTHATGGGGTGALGSRAHALGVVAPVRQEPSIEPSIGFRQSDSRERDEGLERHFNGSTDAMVQDAARWMNGGDHEHGRRWLQGTLAAFGAEATAQAWTLLVADEAAGRLVANPLAAWAKSAGTLKRQAKAVPEVSGWRPSYRPQAEERPHRVAPDAPRNLRPVEEDLSWLYAPDGSLREEGPSC